MTILTKTKFKKWLENKSGVVGLSGSTRECPLAHCLNDTRGDSWRVAVGFYNIRSSDFHAIPPWAREFVRKIDLLPNPITAAKALEILEQI